MITQHKKLGFGFMRLPQKDGQVDVPQTKEMVDLFLQRGFRYFDVARPYLEGKAESYLRQCLTSRYSRDQYILTNKLSGAVLKPRRIFAHCLPSNCRTAALNTLIFT